jgi:hypothetical protein
VTGNFEVTLDGKLVHSKRAGAGKCESAEEKAAVSAAISELIGGKD